MAPEVVNLKDLKAKYDPICDMFSMGVIFHMLTLKKSPFPGKEYNEVLSQNRACNIDYGLDMYKKLPDSCKFFIFYFYRVGFDEENVGKKPKKKNNSKSGPLTRLFP